MIYNRDLNTHSLIRQFYDLNWNRIIVDDDVSENISKPKSLKRMIHIAEVLSTSLAFVRVDLYEVNSRPYFGELTFTPGFDQSIAYNKLGMGNLINIVEKE